MKVHRLHNDVLIMERNETRKAEESVKKVKKTNKKVTAKKDETQEVKAEKEV